MWRITSGKNQKDGLRLTFIQPVSQAVKDNFLLAGGNQAESSALHWCSVVNVVFKDEDLDGEKQKETHRYSRRYCGLPESALH